MGKHKQYMLAIYSEKDEERSGSVGADLVPIRYVEFPRIGEHLRLERDDFDDYVCENPEDRHPAINDVLDCDDAGLLLKVFRIVHEPNEYPTVWATIDIEAAREIG